MPQQLDPVPEELSSITVPSTGDPRDSGPMRAVFQKLLNFIAGVLRSVSPSGTVVAFAGPAAPSGWLLCNGQAVSRTDYASLYAAIGTTFGQGNGTTTFNLPDLRGRTVIGVGQGPGLTNRTRGQTGGEETHALTTQEMPQHDHNFEWTRTTDASTDVGPDGYLGITMPNLIRQNGATFNSTVSVNPAGGNGAHNTLPPYLALNYIIRAAP